MNNKPQITHQSFRSQLAMILQENLEHDIALGLEENDSMKATAVAVHFLRTNQYDKWNEFEVMVVGNLCNNYETMLETMVFKVAELN